MREFQCVVQSNPTTNGMPDQMKAFKPQTMAEVFQKVDKFRYTVVVVYWLTESETRKIWDIYSIMLAEFGCVLQPPPGTNTSPMDNNKWLALPTGKVVNIKFARIYLLAVYVVYSLTSLMPAQTCLAHARTTAE